MGYDLKVKVVIVGGCGHVGLPLGVSLANLDFEVTAYDINATSVEQVNSGSAPFLEEGLEAALKYAIKNGFKATTIPSVIKSADIVIMIIGTPLNEEMIPDNKVVFSAFHEISDFLHDEQLIILRSTVFPGCTKQIEMSLNQIGKYPDITFCPERILEGKSMKELQTLPQIIGADNDKSFDRSVELFKKFGVKIIRTTPEEAELVKLFTNTWRYIKFAAANEFWMIANNLDIDFENVRNAITFDYPRAADLPSAGFTAGPCLYKDTKQLSFANQNNFAIGNAAIEINEGFPNYVVDRVHKKYDLSNLTVGILGMAFKGESDDTRSSLSYSIKDLLHKKSKSVLTHDPYVRHDPDLVTLQEIIENSDILIIGAPHNLYKAIASNKPIIDVWNLLKRGSSI
jgi:UDP-N-acetyl-D-mannosaminuronic acid dehydrogenase